MSILPFETPRIYNSRNYKRPIAYVAQEFYPFRSTIVEIIKGL